MDPYELFSTPPSDMVLSSTPTKPPKKVLNSTPIRPQKKQPPTFTPQSKRTPIGRQGRQKKSQQSLWDKCLKTDPALAQFVDNFNQSLEEAISKPLNMSTDE